MRIGLHHEIEHRGAGIADMKRLPKALKNGRTGVVVGTEGEFLGQCLGGFVELEAGENVERETFARGIEERVVLSPVEELED